MVSAHKGDLSISRMLGHEKDMPGSGQWRFTKALDKSACWHCHNWIHTIIFWNEEIGIAYPKTSEGRQAPLRRVDITDAWPQDLAGIPKERMTPTFILVADGVEIDRLRGYPGEHFFWPLLTDMLGKLPDTSK